MCAAKSVVLRRYYGQNDEVLADIYGKFEETIELYGSNQLHIEETTLLPCGNPNKEMADSLKYHEEECHTKTCNGNEHITICNIPTKRYLAKWGKPCKLNCVFFFK